MSKYITKTIVINVKEIPYTIKLISNSNSDEAATIHAITLKAKLNSYLAINESLSNINLIKNIFEKFLRPLLDRRTLIAAAVNGGGDIQTGVAKGQDYIWNIAIENPENVKNNIYTYHLQNGAIATESLKSESSDSKQPLLKQATIIAANLIEASDLATKALTMGEQQFAKLSKRLALHGILINQKNTLTVLN
ncbi:hypothetical protein RD055328_12930 [Companilactobacillus sp. RD055328]|uniref:hypothetical protein n=1 Tax=Companilactobacillus sp. RD055328 TaxID=2916634 RepID=UPI001FC826CC|nr:hypothetical protein [Companilactobacillus sp. RD055328]GKQ43370.1 hypothetical protein RD055328_12930 [Companilactobacillus sp. RD055328]